MRDAPLPGAVGEPPNLIWRVHHLGVPTGRRPRFARMSPPLSRPSMKRAIEQGRNRIRRPMRTAGSVPRRTRRLMPLSLRPVVSRSQGISLSCSPLVKGGFDGIELA